MYKRQAEYGRDNDILYGFAVGRYAVAERFCVIGSVAVRFTAYRTAAAHNKNGKQCNEKSGRDNKQADNFSVFHFSSVMSIYCQGGRLRGQSLEIY